MKDIVKVLAIIILSLCMGSLFAQQPSNDTINQTDSLGQKQGFWMKYDDEGNKKYQGSFVAGFPKGEFIYYYPKGKVKSKSFFSEKGRHTQTINYYPNGIIMARGAYIDKKKDGEWTYFDEEGNLIREEFYKNNAKHNTWKTYYSDGTLSELSNYNMGERHGKWVQYYTNGNSKIEAHYENGFLNGAFKLYYLNGQLNIKGKYKESMKEGPWIYFKENGVHYKRETYFENVMAKEEIFAMVGSTLKAFDIKKIAYVYKEKEHLTLVKKNAEKYTLNEAFDTLVEMLGLNSFVKISSRFLVNYETIRKVNNNDSVMWLDLDPPSDVPAIVATEYTKPFLPFVKRKIE